MPFISGSTITEIFLKRAQTSPHLIGFQYKAQSGVTRGQWRNVSFREFFVDVKALSFGLMSLGLKKGDRVAILSNTRMEWSQIDMAILGAGGISVSIYPSSTPEDLSYILSNSGARFVVVENKRLFEKVIEFKNSQPQLAKGLERVVSIETIENSDPSLLSFPQLKEQGRVQEKKNPQDFENNLTSAKPSDLISIVYTSGTTGVPKGVMITHGNMVSVLDDAVAIFSNFNEPDSDTVLSFLPFSHIFGKVESMAVHTFGWRQAFAEDVDKLLINLTEIRPTLLLCVPRTFEKAYQRIQAQLNASSYVTKRLFHWGMKVGKKYHESVRAGRFPRPREIAEYILAKQLVFSRIDEAFGGRLRFAICGGAPLPPELGEFFQIAGVKILEGYGLTETAGPIAVNSPDAPRFGTVGRPMSEVSARIGEDGEIEIQSKKVFAGYFNAKIETAEAMNEGWFKTGDIGFIDDDGYIHITGRKKDLIVTSGGKNVAPQKLESLAKSHTLIHQMVVLGDRRPYLIALLSLDREQVIQLATEKKILFSEYSELIKNPKIIALVQHTIDEINKSLAKYESIRKFMILPDDLSIERGEVTPSLKIKRGVVETRYEKQIDALYSAPEATQNSTPSSTMSP